MFNFRSNVYNWQVNSFTSYRHPQRLVSAAHCRCHHSFMNPKEIFILFCVTETAFQECFYYSRISALTKQCQIILSNFNPIFAFMPNMSWKDLKIALAGCGNIMMMFNKTCISCIFVIFNEFIKINIL